MNPYDSAGHIYVNGFGFVSEDPWFRENRALFKNAVVIGLVLIGILVLPTLCLYPVRLLLNILFTPFYYLGGSAYASVGLQRVYSETERLLLELLAVGIPLIFAGLLLRPRRKGLFLTRKPSPNLFSGSVSAPWFPICPTACCRAFIWWSSTRKTACRTSPPPP